MFVWCQNQQVLINVFFFVMNRSVCDVCAHLQLSVGRCSVCDLCVLNLQLGAGCLAALSAMRCTLGTGYLFACSCYCCNVITFPVTSCTATTIYLVYDFCPMKNIMSTQRTSSPCFTLVQHFSVLDNRLVLD